MKKILSIIICIWLISFTLVACCGSNTAEAENFNNRFVIIEKCDLGSMSTGYILVDTTTGVLYQFIKSGYGGGLTVMLDTDGKPLTYPGG